MKRGVKANRNTSTLIMKYLQNVSRKCDEKQRSFLWNQYLCQYRILNQPRLQSVSCVFSLIHRYGGAAFGEELHNISSDILSSTTGGVVSALAARRNAKIWYNLKGYHSLPVFINKINNAILRTNLKDEGRKHGRHFFTHFFSLYVIFQSKLLFSCVSKLRY